MNLPNDSGALSLFDIRNCLEGVVPGALATTGADGTPNVAYVSQALYLNDQHLALSFQFFNKTRENILNNPLASLLIIDPASAARYRLQIVYTRTETDGPVFEKMRAKLAGIAQHEGVVGIFSLKGADVYRVVCVEHLPGKELPVNFYAARLLRNLRAATEQISGIDQLEALIEVALASLKQHFDIDYRQFWIADRCANKLVALAIEGYETSSDGQTMETGVGVEIPFGIGVIGTAALHKTAIRILFAAQEWAYTRQVRERAIAQDLAVNLEAHIPLPGLIEPASQLALPLMVDKTLKAVLFVESERSCCFGYDEENALTVFCRQMADSMHRIEQQAIDESSEALSAPSAQLGQNLSPAAPSLPLAYFPRDHSVFMRGEYLIKGVAGAILWYLVNQYSKHGRCIFTNRELRLQSSLPLPELVDNLEARLLLLSRRLRERGDGLVMEKSGRGQFKLLVSQRLLLTEQSV